MANPDLKSIKESKFLRFDLRKDSSNSTDIRNGISEISYYESILTCTSNMEVTVMDAGGGAVVVVVERMERGSCCALS